MEPCIECGETVSPDEAEYVYRRSNLGQWLDTGEADEVGPYCEKCLAALLSSYEKAWNLR